MTKNDANQMTDPFDGTKMERRVLVGYTPQKTENYPKGRAIAAAFWASYFVLHWLTILEVVERSATLSGTTVFFLAGAILTTFLIAADEAAKEKKSE